MRDDSLQQKLIEDLETEEEAEALLPLIAQLRAAPVPKPSRQSQAQLQRRLRANFAQLTQPAARSWQARLQWLYWLLRAQMRVVQAEIWQGSAFVMALGVVVTLAVDLQALPFVLVAPIVAAIGITFLYGPGVDPTLEIELATAVPPRLILFSRMTLLFGIDLLLGLLGSVLLATLRSDISLVPLVSTWLAPMAFLSTFALFFSLVSFEPLLGVMLSLILWGVQTMRQFDWLFHLPAIIPNLLLTQWQPWLWLGTVLLGGTAVWLAGREEWVINQR